LVEGKNNESVNAKCEKHVIDSCPLASGCGELAQLEYEKKHGRIRLKVCWELCKKYGVKVSSDEWYEECLDKVRKSVFDEW